MPVKHWSFAGLVLTYWCNAACESCYVCCSPRRTERMGVEQALDLWRGLIAASPHGCRVHLTGGEPFGDWPGLIELCRRARAQGLGPLEKVETNAFWATEEGIVRERVGALDAAGMGRLVISADPYHQQFVPIQRCRLAASVGQQILGPDRVQVRWRDWLAEGFDTSRMPPERRGELFAAYAAGGRDRLHGRAARTLAAGLCPKPPEAFADNPCQQPLLRSRHVHVDPAGRVMGGTCAAIVLGVAGPRSIAEIWRKLDAGFADRPIVGRLARLGPVGLLGEAVEAGFQPADGYATKCHLCWEIRRWLAGLGLHDQELAPAWMYQGPTEGD